MPRLCVSEWRVLCPMALALLVVCHVKALAPRHGTKEKAARVKSAHRAQLGQLEVCDWPWLS
jgi:hypothetical protein